MNGNDVKGILGYITEPVRNEILAVGVTAVQVSEQRLSVQKRKVFFVRNTSDDPSKIITVTYGGLTNVANQGFVLRQNESFTDSTSEGYECFQGVVTAICAAADGQLTVVER